MGRGRGPNATNICHDFLEWDNLVAMALQIFNLCLEDHRANGHGISHHGTKTMIEQDGHDALRP
jgi:hypothetical protein